MTRVPVYRWALPEDTGPLHAALTEIAERRIGAALFTSAQQVEHVLQVAAAAGIEDGVPHGVRRARRRRLDRADDIGRPARARLAGRHRAGAPQVGPSRVRGRDVVAQRQEGRKGLYEVERLGASNDKCEHSENDLSGLRPAA